MRWYIGFLLLAGALPQLFGQTASTCSDYSTSTTALTRLQPSGTQQHSSGLHSWGITPVFGCTYAHGSSAFCDTECTVTSVGATVINPIGASFTIETGSLNA